MDDVDGLLHGSAVHHHLHRLHLDPEQVVGTCSHLALLDQVRPAGDVGSDAVVQRWRRRGARGDRAVLAGHDVRHRGRRVVPRAVGAADAVEALLVAVVVVAWQVALVRDWQTGLGQCCKVWAGQPRVAEDGGEGRPLSRVHSKALPYKVLALRRHPVSEPEFRDADLLVRLEGDVSADHVEEEDAEGPDGGELPVVTVLADPLWRGVHSRACNLQRHTETRQTPNFSFIQLHFPLFQICMTWRGNSPSKSV